MNFKIRASIILCLFSFSFLQCEMEENEEPLEKFITITWPSFYYNSSITEQVFLTDQDGKLIDKGSFIAGETTELGIPPGETSTYDLTFLRRITYSDGSIFLNAYTALDVKTHDFIIPYEINPNRCEITSIVVNDVPGTFFDIQASKISSIDSTSNSYTFNFCKEIGNRDDVYISWQMENELSRKYLLLNNITIPLVDPINYNDIPSINTATPFNYPEGSDRIFSTLIGIFEEAPDVRHILSFDEDFPINHYIPEKVFDQFLLYTIFRYGDYNYELFRKTNEPEPTITPADLELEIIDGDPYDFEFTSNSSYDYFAAYFYFLEDQDKFFIDWTVFGKQGAVTKFSIPRSLEQIIATDYQRFTFENLTTSGVEISKIEGIPDYETFILFKAETLLEDEISNMLTREDAVFKSY